jgi:hypothetical protein
MAPGELYQQQIPLLQGPGEHDDFDDDREMYVPPRIMEIWNQEYGQPSALPAPTVVPIIPTFHRRIEEANDDGQVVHFPHGGGIVEPQHHEPPEQRISVSGVVPTEQSGADDNVRMLYVQYLQVGEEINRLQQGGQPIGGRSVAQQIYDTNELRY